MSKKKLKQLSPELVADKYEAGLLSEITIPIEEELFVPTHSPVVNYQLGGGFVYGRIAEISGFPSSGKSLIAMDAVAAAQELGGVGIWIDAEMAFSRSWAEINGIDIDNLFLYPENIIEKISDFSAEICLAYRGELVNNEPIVLVIDSIAALDTQLAMGASETDAKAEMGTRAKAIYKMLRLRNRLWSKLGITVILINQLRETISSGFGAQFKDSRATPGGKALPFYASQRVYLEVKKTLTTGSKEKKRKVGVEVAFEMKKNKIAIPKATRRIPIIFHPDGGEIGFDKFYGIVDILIQEGAIVRDGRIYTFEGEELASSRDELEETLIDDPELLSDVCNKAGILTIPEVEKRLDSLTENRYPVTSDLLGPVGSNKKEEEDE